MVLCRSAPITESLRDRGFAIVERVLDEDGIRLLLAALARVGHSESSLRVRGGIFAVRNLLQVVPEVSELAASQTLRQLVEPVLGDNFHPVRGLLFDKVAEANWKVPWHQDVTIAVRSRVEAEGFGPWSTKAGVLHVQPPAWILENILSVRLHLDSCDEKNGALRVVPGSHRKGRIHEDAIPELRGRLGESVCAVEQGGALLIRPLILHASSPSQAPSHRRVIHLDFASVRLPDGMCWDVES